MSDSLKLGVNIDHVATLREVRGGVDYPDPLEAALVCKKAGAHSITVHLREDRRHIQDHDVTRVREQVALPLNLEMAATEEMVNIARAVKPDEVCLVPEKREELTTEGGLDVVGFRENLAEATAALSAEGIQVSLFVDPDPEQLAASAEIGAPVVELHTGSFCNARGAAADAELAQLVQGATIARELGLKVNAGHGITLDNLPAILTIPFMDTLNIGHSLVCRSVFVGLEVAVAEMLQGMQNYRS